MGAPADPARIEPARGEQWRVGKKGYRNRGANRRAKRPSEILFMQDWILVLAPVSLVTYFLLFPDQFHHFMAWFGHLIR
jgi:hypothetical protein